MNDFKIGDKVYVSPWDDYSGAIAEVVGAGVFGVTLRDLYTRDGSMGFEYPSLSNVRLVTEEEIALFLLGGSLE